MNEAEDIATNAFATPVRFDVWEFNCLQNTLSHIHSKQVTRLEPKVSDLLSLLLHARGEVVLKQELLEKLWSGMVVGEDTLARTVSRLRSVLSDSASNPRFIETIPKRGYRMIVTAEPVKTRQKNAYFLPAAMIAIVIIGLLLAYLVNTPNGDITDKLKRADGLYMEFNEQSNESALALYQDVLNSDPDNSQAQAGVANAMVQRLVRWPDEQYKIDVNNISLTSALSSGQLDEPEAKLMLERARLFAKRAVRQSPGDIQAHKSLGFVYSAEGKIERAIAQYQRAIELDDTAWRSMINLGELLELKGQRDKSIDTFINAFEAMQARFKDEPQHIGPWQPSLGNIVAGRFLESGDNANAELWANRVLALVPFQKQGSEILLTALANQGKDNQIRLFCDAYPAKLEPPKACLSLAERY